MTVEPIPGRRPRILLVEDDPATHELFMRALGSRYEFLPAPSGERALARLADTEVDLVLLDIHLPGIDGLEVLRRLREGGDDTPVIALTEVHDLRTAIEVMKLGALDYLTKPFGGEGLRPHIDRALERQALVKEVLYLREAVGQVHAFDSLIGESPAIREILELVDRVAETAVTVLLTGESGTGKEVVARVIHQRSPRRRRPFVPINCAALPMDLLESELFGHEKGAFTGAGRTKLGKFELADGGTLFLDEIGNLRLDLQPKLLRALQDRVIERVGGTRRIPIDVHVIAATNEDMEQALAERRFRQDLFYRLNVVPMHLPPLRHRPEDIPSLVDHLLAKCTRKLNRAVRGVSAPALRAMQEYSWPGNVRELENVIERAVALTQTDIISLKELPREMSVLLKEPGEEEAMEYLPLQEAVRQFERDYILRALRRVSGNQSAAARILGVHRNTLGSILKRHGLDQSTS